MTTPTPSNPPAPPAYVKALWVLICILTSLLAAFVGGTLIRLGGNAWTLAFYSGGGVFVVVLGLCLTLLNTLWPK